MDAARKFYHAIPVKGKTISGKTIKKAFNHYFARNSFAFQCALEQRRLKFKKALSKEPDSKLFIRNQQNFSAGHVAGVLLQTLFRFFERQPRADFGF